MNGISHIKNTRPVEQSTYNQRVDFKHFTYRVGPFEGTSISKCSIDTDIVSVY